MKLVFILLFLTLCSCVKTDIIYGNGNVITLSDTLEEFSGAVVIDLNCDVVIDSGEPVIALTLDENLQRYIGIDTAGGNIRISKNEDYDLTMTDLSLHLTLPVLSDLTIYQGSVISTLNLSDSVNLNLHGSSFFKGEVSDPVARISLYDQSESELYGSVTDCKLMINSDSVVNLDSLLTYNTTVDIDRDVDTKLHALNELHGTLHGAGNLLISTAPAVTTIKTTGSGKVKYSVDSDESIIHVE